MGKMFSLPTVYVYSGGRMLPVWEPPVTRRRRRAFGSIPGSCRPPYAHFDVGMVVNFIDVVARRRHRRLLRHRLFASELDSLEVYVE